MNELGEQIKFCDYIKLRYPDVVFHSDSSGDRKTIGQAMRAKRLNSSNGIPDIFIAEPRGKFHGLYIEMKKTGEKLYKKDGVTFKTPHLVEQNEVLFILRCKGYRAEFAIGLQNAISLFEDYMSQ